jgi:hypothetical protein
MEPVISAETRSEISPNVLPALSLALIFACARAMSSREANSGSSMGSFTVQK